MLYDPQQRPTASQALQYPFFQVNNSVPPPVSTSDPIPSTFTKRPIQKSEAEIKADDRMFAKKVSKITEEKIIYYD